MKKTSKKLLSALLALAMVTALIPAAAFGALADGNNLTVSADKTIVAVGDTVVVTLSTEEVTVCSYTGGFRFDMELFTCESIEDARGKSKGYIFNKEEDEYIKCAAFSTVDEANTWGTVGFALVGVSDVTYSAGVVIKATFRAKAEGDAVFTVYEDSDGADGARYQSGDEVSVEAVDVATYTVTFDANGGTSAPEAQQKFDGIDLVLTDEEPVWEGHIFLGWETVDNVYQPGDLYTADADVTLYAMWQIEIYTVMFDANGGVSAPEAQTKAYGEVLTLTADKPTREGYIFRGWATTVDATEVEYRGNNTYTDNADVTLYAVWEVKTYDVILDANGGAFEEPGSDMTAHNLAPYADVISCGRDVFDGVDGLCLPEWIIDGDAATPWMLGGEYENDYESDGGVWIGLDFGETVTFTRVELLWAAGTRATEYTVETSDDGENWTVQEVSVLYGDPGEEPYQRGDPILDTVTFASPVTARFLRVVATACNDDKYYPRLYEMSVFDTIDSQQKTHGVDLTITNARPVRENGAFLGWATAADATEALYAPGDVYVDNAGITLYAVWQYVLIGDVNGDEEVDASDLTALARHVGGIEELLDPNSLLAADVNGDGAVDAADLTKLARIVGGIE